MRLSFVVFLPLVSSDECHDLCVRFADPPCSTPVAFCNRRTGFCSGVEFTVGADAYRSLFTSGGSRLGTPISCAYAYNYAGAVTSPPPGFTTVSDLQKSICQTVDSYILPSLNSFPFGKNDDVIVLGGSKSPISVLFENLQKLRSRGKRGRLSLSCFPDWRYSFDSVIAMLVNTPGSAGVWSDRNRQLVSEHKRLFAMASVFPVWKAYTDYVDFGLIKGEKAMEKVWFGGSIGMASFDELYEIGKQTISRIPESGLAISELPNPELVTVHELVSSFLIRANQFFRYSNVGRVKTKIICTSVGGRIVEFYRYELLRGSEALQEKARQQLVLFVRTCSPYLSDSVRKSVLRLFLIRHTNGIRKVPEIHLPALWIDQNSRDKGSYLADEFFKYFARLRKISLARPEDFKVKYTGFPTSGVGPTKQAIEWFLASVVEYSIKENSSSDDVQAKKRIKIEQPLFTYSDDRREHIRPSIARTDDASLTLYRTIGRVIGLAISLDMQISVPFSLGFWYLVKHLPEMVGQDILHDLKNSPAVEYLSLEDPDKYMILTNQRNDCPITSLYGMEFALSENELDSSNHDSYLLDQAMHDVFVSIAVQMKAVVSGIYEVIPFPQLSYLTVDELRGSGGAIDVDEWKRTTIYEFGYDLAEIDRCKEIKWFWEIVCEFDQVDLGLLLGFVSGSKLPPLSGFGVTWMKIIVNPAVVANPFGETIDQPFRSSTCFKYLKMGTFSSKEKMKEILLNSIRVEFMDNI